ncbi:septal ring lytic transglycosylase RlpA family protein [Pseudoroseomonas globiformis]|uniref:Endolytic peptidoglycan transglycosylase RlpA n=1 Tax=Teichococcus globiformis TaxID=2307229 RepID=A0ABV7G029_9PROT
MHGMKIALLSLVLGTGMAVQTPAEAREPRQGNSVQTAAQQRGAGQAKRVQRGRASFYANHFHGKKMANGKRFNRNSDAAASRTLPLGTRARVKNLENGRSAVVTIQDRGPYKQGRVIDVSPRTATQLGMRDAGVVMVEVTPVALPPG